MKLTNQRRNWASSRGATIVGKPLAYPAPAAREYERKLQALIEKLTTEYNREVRKVFRDFGMLTTDASVASQARIVLNELDRRWESVFTSAARDIVEGFISRTDRFAQRDAEASLRQLSGGLSIQTPDMPQGLVDKLRAATAENVALIKSIPDQYFLRIEGAVMRSITSGQGGSATLFDEMMKYEGMTKNRARRIAVDQTRKVTSAANVERMKSAGVRKWRWLHSGGGADPRRLHLRLDGQVFSYEEDPPVIDDDGTRGYPGQLPECKCIMQPVVSFAEEDD